MHSRQPLFGLRLIRRRLQVIQRPAVWGTALVVSATVIIFLDYWRGYSRTNLARQNTPAGSIDLDEIDLNDPNLLLSDEDRAIAADIDTVPLLLRDFQGLEAEASPEPEATPASSPSSTPSPLPSILPGFPEPPEAVDRSALQNPFSVPRAAVQAPPSIGASPLLPRSPLGADLSGRGGMGAASIDTGSVAPVGLSPLQQAIQRHQQVLPLEQTQGLPSAAIFPSTPALPSVVGSSAPELSSPQIYRIPAQTSPPLGTTGYTLPPTLRTVPPTVGDGSAPMQLPESTFAQPSPQGQNGVPPVVKP